MKFKIMGVLAFALAASLFLSGCGEVSANPAAPMQDTYATMAKGGKKAAAVASDTYSGFRDTPGGMDIGPDGMLYVADRYAQRIVVIDPATMLQGGSPINVGNAVWGVRFDGTDMYYTVPGEGLFLYGVGQVGDTIPGARGFDIVNGVALVAAERYVYSVELSTGVTNSAFFDARILRSMTAGPNGLFYTVDQDGSNELLTLDGALNTVVPPQFVAGVTRAHAVSFDPSGMLMVTDYRSGVLANGVFYPVLPYPYETLLYGGQMIVAESVYRGAVVKVSL